MKIDKSIIKLVIWMVVGGIAGFFGAIFLDKAGSLTLKLGLPQGIDFLVKNIIFFQVIIGCGLIMIAYANYRKANKLTELEDESEENEELNDITDKKYSLAITLAASNYILSYALFSISIDERNMWMFGSILVFLFFIAVSFFLEIKIINQVKKRDPMKKGNPSENDFDQQWLDSCDEAEKLMIFQAAYKTFNLMKHVLLIAMIFMFISKLNFGTGNIPIILVATLWLIQTVSYSYFGNALHKNKLT